MGDDLITERADDIRASLTLTLTVSCLGLPAAVVPAGIDDGLPQAVQVVAGRFREDLCLRAAETIEHACSPITPIDPLSR